MKFNLKTAEIVHEGDDVSICLKIPASTFLKFVESLKANKKAPVKKITEAPDLRAKRTALFELLKNYRDAHPKKYPKQLYNDFLSWWGESSKDGKKIRYEEQKYFDIPKRLVTFWKNVKPDDKDAMWLNDSKEEKTLFN